MTEGSGGRMESRGGRCAWGAEGLCRGVWVRDADREGLQDNCNVLPC